MGIRRRCYKIRVVRVDITEKVSNELRLEGDREFSQLKIWVRNIPRRRNGLCVAVVFKKK